MPQQINLCTPILLAQKRYFSAATMAVSLGVFLLLGGALCAIWVWNLQSASRGYNGAIDTQAREIESLQAAIVRSRANAAPVDPALQQSIMDTQTALAARQNLLLALQAGLLVPGFAHSDRLRWVASSIPEPVWVTRVAMEDGRFDVAGFTLEPAALNEWVAKLSASPLMHNLRLSNVKIESTSLAASTADRPVVNGQPTWAFNLESAEPLASLPASASHPAGGRP